MTKDVNVFLKDFPNTKDKEVVTENADGTYSVFINSRIAHNQQLLAYQHAIEHIKAIAHAASEPVHQDVKLPTIRRRRRKRRNRWAQVERQRKEKEALGITAWAEYEAHWLDPEYKF